MVSERGYSPVHFVDMISTNAAKIMGLYPRNGALAVGSGCLHRAARFRHRQDNPGGRPARADYTLWEGHRVTAWPAATILRGRVMVDGGAFHGDLKDGSAYPRGELYALPS